MEFVMSLRDLDREDVAIAGGKGANLGELVRAGLQVPDGFLVTTEAYARVVNLLDLKIADGVAGGDGVAIRASVEAAAMPADIQAAIADAYTALGSGPVAVRSSATAEDLPGAAFAGQQDTYLNIIGEAAVLDAVRRCWGSLWTDRAIAYRDRIGIEQAEVKIAVVVQRMINAEIAGVMFTADPVSGDRKTILVDASSGLGEAVVSGLVTPDHYVLDDAGNVRDFQQGRREVVIRSAAAGGVVREAGGTEDAQRSVRQCARRASTAGHDDRQTIRAPARHRMGVRRQTGLAAAGTSHDSAPTATAQAQRPATGARLRPSRLRPGSPLSNRHEHLGAVRSGRTDGQGRRDLRVA